MPCLYQMVAHNMLRICQVKLKKEISSDDAVDVNKCHEQIELILLLHTFASHSELTSHIRIMVKTIFFIIIRFVHIGQIFNAFYLESGGAKWTANKRKTEQQEENHSAIQVCVCVREREKE